MSLFRRQAPLERRDLTSSSAIPSNLDGWSNPSGQVVTTDTALRLAAVYGSVSLIADSLSTTPIDTYRKRADGRREPLPTPSLLDLPSGDVEPVEWLSALFASALLRGNAYGRKDAFDDLGYPREIHLVHPDDASVRRDRKTGEKIYRFGNEDIPRREVFHLRGFTLPGALTGLSPIGQFAATIGTGLGAQEYGARFYNEGGHPTATIETDHQVTEAQANAVKERILRSIRGRREPVVLGAGLKWSPIQIPPNESMFLESLKFSALQVATMIFHVPASFVGVAVQGESLTYSNREQDEISLQTRAMLPWAVRFEQHISRLLPRRQYIKFNMNAGVRVDLTTRYKAHEIGIRSGFLLRDEARELEDRPPLTPAQEAEANPPAPPAAPTEEDDDE